MTSAEDEPPGGCHYKKKACARKRDHIGDEDAPRHHRLSRWLSPHAKTLLSSSPDERASASARRP